VPRVELDSDTLTPLEGSENTLVFSFENPFDEEVEVTLLLAIGAGMDISKVLSCEEAVGNTCKVTRLLSPGVRTSVSVNVIGGLQTLDQTIPVQGTASYTVAGESVIVTRELNLKVRPIIQNIPKTGLLALFRSVLMKPMLGTVTLVALAVAIFTARVGSSKTKNIEEFVKYIDRYRKRGYTEEQIRRDLKISGVDDETIQNSFDEVRRRMGH